MGFWTLTILWVGLAAVRVAFVVYHLRDLDGLWSDYDRRGSQFQLARGLDLITLGLFASAAVWSLWGMEAETPERLGRVFSAWLGFTLLELLPVHRFPRTNQPGGLEEAKLALGVHVLMAVLVALAATGLAALYYSCFQRSAPYLLRRMG